ncbi:c-type cytochrome [Sungkyunkwania multivorans]|uniref:C-type cytochrome n=1 Tax=Sungkyunkwania multivorans TaxID=1173618 RepID=A0ABW3CVC5_9FLAO
MKSLSNIAIVIMVAVVMTSCFDKSQPNYQFFPNMYESVGYETYSQSSAFPEGIEAMQPVDGTISRGWMPYDYEDSEEGYQAAKANLKNPLEANEENLAEGKELYGLYCAICHGAKGNGQGWLVQNEKFLGVPSYDDAGRAITEGSIYHVVYYGRNAMGSHAAQINEKERWQITQYVLKLKADLEK